ncbi:hypothetical protein [Bradyrhizobium retamae]|uniref:hypothetical protein n=1 Tax=Bradyrhizobium retamae TaxID=1300035 RepID=UPI0012E353B2|nr:hypothetical protein [Bradyrhizobium retamae]
MNSRNEISVLAKVLPGVDISISTTRIDARRSSQMYRTYQIGPMSGLKLKSPESSALAIIRTASLLLIGKENAASISAAMLTPSASNARAMLPP